MTCILKKPENKQDWRPYYTCSKMCVLSGTADVNAIIQFVSNIAQHGRPELLSLLIFFFFLNCRYQCTMLCWVDYLHLHAFPNTLWTVISDPLFENSSTKKRFLLSNRHFVYDVRASTMSTSRLWYIRST